MKDGLLNLQEHFNNDDNSNATIDINRKIISLTEEQANKSEVSL